MDWHTYFVSQLNVWVHNTCARPIKKILTKEEAWILPGSLPREEEEAVLKTLGYIDKGIKPSGELSTKWGWPFYDREK